MPCTCLLNEGLGLGRRNMGKLHVLINVQSIHQLVEAVFYIPTLMALHCTCQQLNHNNLQIFMRKILDAFLLVDIQVTRL